jgi:SRSO17 transposase
MTEPEIAALGPAFAAELRTYRGCFQPDRTAGHFGTSCRGLRSDLPRKTAEPIARAAGTAVRTLQEFLVTAAWDHAATRDRLPHRLAAVAGGRPAGNLGTVGVIDETSGAKKGDKTPGVQRQYLGCAGKIDNGVVTAHVGLARGDFRASPTPGCTCRSRGPTTAPGAGRPASRTPSGTGRSGGSRSTS